MKSIMAAMMMVCVVTTNSFGTTYTSPTEYSAGFGDNSVHIAVDFDYDKAFVFEYQWDGDATAKVWDALSEIDIAVDSLVVVATDWDPSEDRENYFIDDISYPGGLKHPYDFSLWPYWNVFSSQDGCLWDSASCGVSEIPVQNGYWYSLVWTYAMPDNNWLPERWPGEMPIPEPMTLTLMAFGVVMVVRKKM